MIKFNVAVQEVIKAVGEVPGTSVQTYSEDRVERAVQATFTFLMNKNWWEDYTVWKQHELDGELGIITDDAFGGSAELEALENFNDIRIVMRGDSTEAIPVIGTGFNPFSLEGTEPRYIESLHHKDSNYLNRRIQFWPKTATGTVVTHAMYYSVPSGEQSIYLDRSLITDGAAWMILEQEDVNPNAAGMHKSLFDNRYRDIINRMAGKPLETPYSRGQIDPRYDWWTKA